MTTLDGKIEGLRNLLRQLERVVVCFSGVVDSRPALPQDVKEGSSFRIIHAQPPVPLCDDPVSCVFADKLYIWQPTCRIPVSF